MTTNHWPASVAVCTCTSCASMHPVTPASVMPVRAALPLERSRLERTWLLCAGDVTLAVSHACEHSRAGFSSRSPCLSCRACISASSASSRSSSRTSGISRVALGILALTLAHEVSRVRMRRTHRVLGLHHWIDSPSPQPARSQAGGPSPGLTVTTSGFSLALSFGGKSSAPARSSKPG